MLFGLLLAGCAIDSSSLNLGTNFYIKNDNSKEIFDGWDSKLLSKEDAKLLSELVTSATLKFSNINSLGLYVSNLLINSLYFVSNSSFLYKYFESF